MGQPELVNLHHYTYEMDIHSLLGKRQSEAARNRIFEVNKRLVECTYFSTQKSSNYHKIMGAAPDSKSVSSKEFQATKFYAHFLDHFMTTKWFQDFTGLGFPDINLKEKEINSLSQTVFYLTDMMSRQSGRMEFEFEKECINEMARYSLRKQRSTFDGQQVLSVGYKIDVRIGHGFTYSKYNTLMHFLNVAECYWQNPDLNNLQVFGKDIRALLTVSCQKLFFEKVS